MYIVYEGGTNLQANIIKIQLLCKFSQGFFALISKLHK
jgi:hypothetical protein